MIFLYSFLLLFLGTVKRIIDRRAAGLERKHGQTAKAADGLVRVPFFREGSTSRPDAFEAAKRQYQLGLLVQKRDRIEAKYDAWQHASEKVGTWVSRLRHWKGKKLPYTFGVVDVSLVLGLIDWLGAGHYVHVRSLAHYVSTLLGR